MLWACTPAHPLVARLHALRIASCYAAHVISSHSFCAFLYMPCSMQGLHCDKLANCPRSGSSTDQLARWMWHRPWQAIGLVVVPGMAACKNLMLCLHLGVGVWYDIVCAAGPGGWMLGCNDGRAASAASCCAPAQQWKWACGTCSWCTLCMFGRMLCDRAAVLFEGGTYSTNVHQISHVVDREW